MRADVNAILVGYAGKVEMLRAIYGSSEEPPSGKPAVTDREFTPELFDAVFG